MKLARFVASFVLLLAILLPLSVSAASPIYLPFIRYGAEPTGWTELIVNGDFEAGEMGWEAYSELGRQIIIPLPQEPSTTAMAAVLGNGSQDIIAQDVVIPPNAAFVQLRFRLARLYLAAPMACTLAVALTIPSEAGSVYVPFTQEALTTPDGWYAYGPIELSGHVGGMVRLHFVTLDTCMGGFAVDDVSLTVQKR